MNKKGQALVEFIIILPIMIFLGFIFIDFILISYNKQRLENIIVDVGEMYKNNESDKEIKTFIAENDTNIIVEFKDSDKYFEVNLVKKYDFLTPGMKNVLKNYKINVERTMYHE